jgi:hypothetical protein
MTVLIAIYLDGIPHNIYMINTALKGTSCSFTRQVYSTMKYPAVFKAGLLYPEISYKTNVVGILLQYTRHDDGLAINYTLLPDTTNLLYVIIMYATCFATSLKVAGSVPDGVIEIFH